MKINSWLQKASIIFLLIIGFVPLARAAGFLDSTTLSVNNYNTGISPGLQLLIDQTLRQHKYKQSLDLLDQELQKDPKNITLLYKKAAIYADMEKYKESQAVLDQIIQLHPTDKQAIKLKDIIVDKRKDEPHNEIGFDQDEAYVSDLQSYWQYSSLHYYRLTDKGNFGGRVNYAKRYGTTGIQYQLEAYPKLTSNSFATLTFAYANTTQILYPNLQYQVEGYIDVANGFEFSLGQGGKKYITFSNQNIWNYTGSIGKYFGNNFMWYRPSYSTPKATLFNEIGLIHYFSDDAKKYLSVKVSAGRLPDIGDVPPLDQMIVISQQGINIAGQLPLKKTLFLRLGAGYNRQDFPTGLIRRITDVSVGFVWQF